MKSVETSSQFKLLPKRIQELINQDMMSNGSSDEGATPFSFGMSKSAEVPAAITGTVFKDDMPDYKGTVGPLTQADVIGAPVPENAEAPQGALSAVAPLAKSRATPDFAAMLAKFVPQDDSSSKYLAMAAALGRPTGFGSFGEKMSNVADALLEQKQNQEKLRAQYTPLIMQQVAAQQAREEQNAYRQEAAQQAQQAQRQAALQQQQFRGDQQALATQAAKERADADRASREAIAAERHAAATSAEKLAGKAPTGYAWGPVGADGNPTMIAVKGGPADTKLNEKFAKDTQALTNTEAGLDRLAAAANQLLEHPGLDGITGVKGVFPNMPGGKAANADALLETLKSQVGFGVLQDMRNNSTTGGALGNVSDKEVQFLQSNLAALKQAQSVDQYRGSLKQIMDYAEAAKGRMRKAYAAKHGAQEQSSSPPEAPPGMPSPDAIAAEIARRKKGS